MSQQPPDKLLTLKEVIAVVAFSKSKIYDMIQLEEFPEQIKLGPSSRWSQREVHAWIEEQKNKRAA